ncbi:hypothetical protein O9X98_04375 [Agrobacterium salinitolerans]|nr:hypothetical protein [Agrobacterium salinitolerans]
MSRISEETKTQAFIDLATDETARLQALAPSMTLSEIVKASIDLLGKAAEALANGLEFGSCNEDGTERRALAFAPLEAARNHETKYVPAKA